MYQRLLVIFLLAVLSTAGFQCVPAGTAQLQGGIYFTEDQGATWMPRNNIVPEQGGGSLSNLSIFDIAINPENHDEILAASQQAGLYKSENGAQSWSSLTTRGQIQAVDINTKQTNELVASRMNQIFFSEDNGEVWSLVYTNPSNQLIIDVVFDYFNENKLYAAVITGELLKSVDNGNTWSLIKRFDHSINRVIVHPQLEERLYIFSKSKGVLRTDDMGENWINVTTEINSPILPLTFIDFDVHPRSIEALLLVSNKDVYMSNDGGKTWSTLKLLVEASEQTVLSVAWDPQSRSRIFYITPSVFHVSSDFGNSWQTSPFASRFQPYKLVVHPQNSDVLYVGTVAR